MKLRFIRIIFPFAVLLLYVQVYFQYPTEAIKYAILQIARIYGMMAVAALIFAFLISGAKPKLRRIEYLFIKYFKELLHIVNLMLIPVLLMIIGRLA